MAYRNLFQVFISKLLNYWVPDKHVGYAYKQVEEPNDTTRMYYQLTSEGGEGPVWRRRPRFLGNQALFYLSRVEYFSANANNLHDCWSCEGLVRHVAQATFTIPYLIFETNVR